MEIRRIREDKELKVFLDLLNEAYKQRSNEKLPFKELVIDEIKKEKLTDICAVFSGNDMIGGVCLKTNDIDNTDALKISHLWTNIRFQKTGVASFLLDYCYNYAQEKQAKYMQLNVANIYEAAVSLYKKKGFKKLKIYANTPGTYYFVRMIKDVDPFVFSKTKRFFVFFASLIKFYMLFKSDSSPNVLCRLIYGTNKN